MPATYIWNALSGIAYWSHDGLKTRFTIGECFPLDGGGYACHLSIMR